MGQKPANYIITSVFVTSTNFVIIESNYEISTSHEHRANNIFRRSLTHTVEQS